MPSAPWKMIQFLSIGLENLNISIRKSRDYTDILGSKV